ncbi:MAG: hypothetical protein P8010_16905, partial [Desulfosarcinaceae bacterium]
MVKETPHIPLLPSRRFLSYLGLAALFFTISFTTLFLVHHFFSEGQMRIPSRLLSVNVIGGLVVLLVLYYLADGLRLYCVIRAMG